MTIERLFTLTAERQNTNDLINYIGHVGHPEISSTKVNTGSYSYRLPGTGNAFGRAFAPISAARVGLWFNHAGLSSSNIPLFMFSAGTHIYDSPTMYVVWKADEIGLGLWRPVTGSTTEELATILTPAELATQNQWTHLGVTYFPHETNGFLSLYINGTRVLNVVGDTRLSYWNGSAQAFSNIFNRIYLLGKVTTLGTTWNLYPYVDDIYADSYDEEPDAPVPMRRFFERIALVSGEDSEFTPLSGVNNYTMVDDGEPNGGPNDGDTTFNKAEAADLRDTFHFPNIVVPESYRVVATIPYSHCRKLDVGPKISLHLFDGMSYSDSPDLDVPADYTVEVAHRFEEMPDGSGFTETDVNNLQIGYRSRGDYA